MFIMGKDIKDETYETHLLLFIFAEKLNFN